MHGNDGLQTGCGEPGRDRLDFSHGVESEK